MKSLPAWIKGSPCYYEYRKPNLQIITNKLKATDYLYGSSAVKMFLKENTIFNIWMGKLKNLMNIWCMVWRLVFQQLLDSVLVVELHGGDSFMQFRGLFLNRDVGPLKERIKHGRGYWQLFLIFFGVRDWALAQRTLSYKLSDFNPIRKQ